MVGKGHGKGSATCHQRAEQHKLSASVFIPRTSAAGLMFETVDAGCPLFDLVSVAAAN